MRIKNTIYILILFIFATSILCASEIKGLVGEYYANRNLEGEPVYRLDERIDFDWGNSSPMDNIPADSFSVRWNGFIRVPESGRYTFYVKSDDGARVWIDGELVFDYWIAQSATERSFEMDMDAEKRYGIRVEYYEVNATASMRLSWESASIRKEVISGENITMEASNDASLITNYTHSKNIPFGRSAILSVEISSEGYLVQWQKSVDGKSWEDVLGANQKDYETPKFDESNNPALYRCRVVDVSNSSNMLYAYTETIRLNPVEPEVFYISKDGSDTNDGKSWNTSFSSLQKAITETEKIGGGNIWIKAGEYDFGDVVELKRGVWIYGGFAGNENNPKERIDGNETIISGGGTHKIFTGYGIDTVKLESLTLANGKAEYGIPSESAAIYAYNSKLDIKKIKFWNNDSDGQVCADAGTYILIEDCEFSNNIGCGINVNDRSKISVSGSRFESNIGGYDGGAMTISSSEGEIEDCVFIGNESTGNNGGAIWVSGGTNSVLYAYGCKFEGNKAQKRGGAIYLYGNGSKIDGCEFTGNVSKSDNGGAIYVDSCSITCENSTFVGNIGNNGGAVYTFFGTSTFNNSTFSGNVARGWNGGAVYNSVRGVTLLNCTIVGNKLEDGRNSAIMWPYKHKELHSMG